MDAQHFQFYIILSNYLWSILFYKNKDHNVREIRFRVCIKWVVVTDVSIKEEQFSDNLIVSNLHLKNFRFFNFKMTADAKHVEKDNAASDEWIRPNYIVWLPVLSLRCAMARAMPLHQKFARISPQIDQSVAPPAFEVLFQYLREISQEFPGACRRVPAMDRGNTLRKIKQKYQRVKEVLIHRRGILYLFYRDPFFQIVCPKVPICISFSPLLYPIWYFNLFYFVSEIRITWNFIWFSYDPERQLSEQTTNSLIIRFSTSEDLFMRKFLKKMSFLPASFLNRISLRHITSCSSNILKKKSFNVILKSFGSFGLCFVDF